MNRRVRGVSGRIAIVVSAVVSVAGMTVAGGSASAAVAPVPHGFAANSVTWISPLQGRVLGQAPCSGKLCTYVLSTGNGGKTWQRFGKVAAPIARDGDPGKPGVTEVHFATASSGFAFAPYLFHTTNGGRTWTRLAIPGGGGQVFDLVSNATNVFALVSPCRWASFHNCTGQMSLWRASALTATGWKRIPMNLPHSTRGDLAVHGRSVYVVDPQVDVTGKKDKFYASTDGGRHFTARSVPCDKPAAPNVPLVQAVATSATNVALLCAGNPGFSKAQKFVYTSTNAAKTYKYAGTTGVWGIQSQLAASRSGNLAVSSVSDGSFIYLNNTHGGTKWTMVWASSDGGAGWNDIQYVTNTEAWVVRGAPSWLLNGPGKLYVSHDAGKLWYLHPIRSAS
jgi:photosystem II stability/assembly factor-like uncharacterized protein